MTHYVRRSGRLEVEWKPDDAEAGYKAIANSAETSCTSESDARETCPIRFAENDRSYKDILAEYERLITYNLEIAPNSDQLEPSNEGSKTVEVSVTNGYDRPVTEQPTTVEVVVGEDGTERRHEVEIPEEKATGTIEVTTSQATGNTIGVQATDIKNHDKIVRKSEKRFIEVA